MLRVHRYVGLIERKRSKDGRGIPARKSLHLLGSENDRIRMVG